MSAGARLIGVLILLALLVVGAHFRDFVSRELLIAFEALALLLVIYGIMLVRQIRSPVRFLNESLQQLRQSDFSIRYREPGLPELDELMQVYNDLIDRLQSERLALGEAMGLFQSLLEVASIGVVILDFDNHPSLVNPAAQRWLGLAADSEVESLAAVNTPLGNALADLTLNEDRLVNLDDGGRVRIRRGSFVDRGFQRGYYLIEELTAPLEQSERDVWERLIRAIAHEVNNTLGAGNSLLDSCREDLQSVDAPVIANVNQSLDVVRERNRRLVAFVKRYASLVHLRELDTEKVDVAQLIDVAAGSWAPKMAESGVTFERRLPADLPSFHLDGDLMQQALSNVLLNAVEACSGGDRVEATAHRESDGAWTLRIADSANALSAVGDAFKPFHTTKADGQGIGLMLVREILRRHGIEHALRSRDGMTEFVMRLPPDLISSGDNQRAPNFSDPRHA